MGQRQDGQVAVQEGQVEPANAADRAVVVAERPERGVGAGVNARIDVEHAVDMRHGQRAGVLEGQAELEDVRVRIEWVGRRIDRLVAKRRRVLADLQIDAALGEPGQVREHVRLDHIELVALIRIDAVQLAQELGIARVGAIHEL